MKSTRFPTNFTRMRTFKDGDLLLSRTQKASIRWGTPFTEFKSRCRLLASEIRPVCGLVIRSNRTLLSGCKRQDRPFPLRPPMIINTSVITYRQFVAESTANIAAVGIAAKILSISRQVAQDKTATTSEKLLSSQIVWLASMVALGVVNADKDGSSGRPGSNRIH